MSKKAFKDFIIDAPFSFTDISEISLRDRAGWFEDELAEENIRDIVLGYYEILTEKYGIEASCVKFVETSISRLSAARPIGGGLFLPMEVFDRAREHCDSLIAALKNFKAVEYEDLERMYKRICRFYDR